MLCSGAELGISCDEGGILDLREDLPLGIDIKDALDLNDLMIDIDLTPNRGDCLSLRGVAREIGVVNRMSVHADSIEKVPPTNTQELPIELADPQRLSTLPRSRYYEHRYKCSHTRLDGTKACRLWFTTN